jgi:hypothetical protein
LCKIKQPKEQKNKMTEFDQMQVTALNTAEKKLMRFFESADNYTKLGYLLSSGDILARRQLETVEKLSSRLNELIAMRKYKRALHFAVALKYQIEQIKKHIN